MKTIYSSLLSVVAVGLLAVDALGAEGSISLPYLNTFEISEHPGYYPGYPIANDAGWNVAYGMTSATVVVSCQNWCSNSPSPYLPSGTTHSNILVINGIVTNFFSNNSPDFAYIDVCLKLPYRATPPPIGTPPCDIPAGNKGDSQNSGTSIQLLAYVNSESNLVFYHLADWQNNYNNKMWSTNPVVIPSNEWVRLTIEIAYNNYTDMYHYYGDSFYRIKINGNTNYYTNMYSYSLEFVEGTPDQSNPSGGPREWFMCANCYSFGTPDSLHSFTVSGSLQIDDFSIAASSVISVNDANVLEGSTTAMVFMVSLSTPEQDDILIGFTTADGTASNGIDYAATNGTVTIPAGQLSTSITVNVLSNTSPATDRGFYVNVTRGFSPVIATGTGTIVEAGTPGLLHVSNVNVTKGATGTTNDAVFEVSRTEPFTNDLSISFATSDDSAVSDIDYRATNGIVTIPSNVANASIKVFVIGNNDTSTTRKRFYLNAWTTTNTCPDATGSGWIFRSGTSIPPYVPPSSSNYPSVQEPLCTRLSAPFFIIR